MDRLCVAVNKKSYSWKNNEYNPDWSRATVELPNDSPYAGYHVDLPPSACTDLHSLALVYIYPEDTYTLIKTKTGLEKGKRFARPIITGEELYGYFRGHEEEAVNDANLWIAETTSYEHRGTFKTRSLSVGFLDNRSFYETDGDSVQRRNVNSFGLILLRPLNYNDALRYSEYKTTLRSLREIYSKSENCVYRFKQFLSSYSDPDFKELEDALFNAYSKKNTSIIKDINELERKYSDIILDSRAIETARKAHIESHAAQKKKESTSASDKGGGK